MSRKTTRAASTQPLVQWMPPSPPGATMYSAEARISSVAGPMTTSIFFVTAVSEATSPTVAARCARSVATRVVVTAPMSSATPSRWTVQVSGREPYGSRTTSSPTTDRGAGMLTPPLDTGARDGARRWVRR